MWITLLKIFPKNIRVFLKKRIFRKTLDRKLAEKLSLDSVLLQNKVTMGKIVDDTTPYVTKYLPNIIESKKEALRHFEFVSQPSEFQKGVIYPLLVSAISFVAGFILRSFF